MLASLPMYDLPEVAGATAAWWAGLARWFRRAGLDEVPDRLTQPTDRVAHWLSPELLFSQTCGYPLTHALVGRVQLVATPCYAAPGCQRSSYRSAIVVAADSTVATFADLRGTVAAVNGVDSHSGFNVPRSMASAFHRGGRFFSHVTVTGSHMASLAAVARGEADIAAIDCVTHALAARHRPRAIEGTRVVLLGPPAPGLPYIAAGGTDDDRRLRLRDGLGHAFEDADLATARDDLLLVGAEWIELTAYDAVLEMERAAVAAGYAGLT